ncbi:DUF1622 domain-containing protein [Actinomadura parmotrematis]|uniref:DUF1622 domain-containing protein n=1 Tax=Actinomadura parmotrematis TaxID=2864039 RepID=A0ABS7G6L1_9ACTN|nr:DUF1622 domain-containing protein [Actinomadura parmotrematis]MBW8487268.1 DUF1622 domain-containing protein [Actinomadura parmotrematis]
MTALLQLAALCCVVAGLVAGGAVGLATRSLRAGLPVALDFWLAAGLLRLGADPGWTSLLATAAIVAVRRLVTWSLGTARTR